ncbi:MAG: YiaA/YiaB family inner membrane protein [Candidatus Cohnella colombiensis]|uniref:YiaA/YiaB family inner membrane protein n=1 Tax=Candidatus Cohnella colombiensis TaxID=3121368 RepID=A0AA95F0Q1_9BACL|nr:MAG: YiaA/YiaB family inner membrane protein [Cohnella sp.]
MAYASMLIGFGMFAIGLFNAPFELNVKGYYIAVILLISFSAIVVQKVTRDNAEDQDMMAEQEYRRNTQA